MVVSWYTATIHTRGCNTRHVYVWTEETGDEIPPCTQAAATCATLWGAACSSWGRSRLPSESVEKRPSVFCGPFRRTDHRGGRRMYTREKSLMNGSSSYCPTHLSRIILSYRVWCTRGGDNGLRVRRSAGKRFASRPCE